MKSWLMPNQNQISLNNYLSFFRSVHFILYSNLAPAVFKFYNESFYRISNSNSCFSDHNFKKIFFFYYLQKIISKQNFTCYCKYVLKVKQNEFTAVVSKTLWLMAWGLSEGPVGASSAGSRDARIICKRENTLM